MHQVNIFKRHRCLTRCFLSWIWWMQLDMMQWLNSLDTHSTANIWNCRSFRNAIPRDHDRKRSFHFSTSGVLLFPNWWPSFQGRRQMLSSPSFKVAVIQSCYHWKLLSLEVAVIETFKNWLSKKKEICVWSFPLTVLFSSPLSTSSSFMMSAYDLDKPHF